MDAPLLPAYSLESGRLNPQGELAITLGVVGLWALALPGITTLPTMAKEIGGFRWKRSQRMGYVALALVAVHLIALGLPGWLNPAGWGALPPVSLLAFVAAIIPLLIRVFRPRGNAVSPDK